MKTYFFFINFRWQHPTLSLVYSEYRSIKKTVTDSTTDIGDRVVVLSTSTILPCQ